MLGTLCTHQKDQLLRIVFCLMFVFVQTFWPKYTVKLNVYKSHIFSFFSLSDAKLYKSLIVLIVQWLAKLFIFTVFQNNQKGNI